MKTKETLQLGKTDFPMRGNLPVREVEWQKEWLDKDLYQQRQKLNEGKPSFVLHDGPPYANGNIHLGHALNKISKDIIIRSKSMSGFRAPYVPGWDTHGLPIEQELAKKGVKRKELSVVEFRELCAEYAWKQVNKQRDDFKRLGVSGDWEHPYVTLDKHYEAAQIRLFGKMSEKGYIYKGLKPVNWSPSSESALAEAEIEYKDIKSPSIYVAFKVVDGKDILDTNTSFIIWTTTPWTLYSNEAITVHPDLDYVQVDADGHKYVVAQGLLESVTKELDWKEVNILQTIKGSAMEYMTAQHPLVDRTSLVILGEHVTLDSGTGLVHTAPGHGDDDYIVGMKYKLPIFSPIDNRGCFTAEVPEMEGVFYDKANPIITDKLKESGALLKLEFFMHSYPHDWRTKKPIIFRATPQWFASIDMFRKEILDAIKKVNWTPDWGETRLYNMVRDRGDWVISRQRAWGVPLPIFYAENGDPIITPETTAHIADLFDEFGSNVWFEREAKDLLPAGFTHPSSPNGEFTKEKDIMDVWFDSGSSHQAVLEARPELTFPADLYLEGSDQYRGWFNSSLTTSIAVTGASPYKAVVSQGMVLDGEGRKMSKSLGNTILPEKVIKQMGADIVRLWVSSVDAQADVRVSMDILGQVSDVYRKIRNTMRFLLANTSDFDSTQPVSYEELRSVDKYMMVRLNQVTAQIKKAYQEFDFSTIYKAINNFCTVDLSSFYLDFAKDVVYIEAADSLERRSMQTVFYQVLVNLTKLMTPILPHTAEEIWTFLDEEEEYVQLAELPEVEHFTDEEPLMESWASFMELRANVLKALEEARNEKVIGKSMQAEVTLYPNETFEALIADLDSNLQQLLIVSKLNISTKTAPKEAHVFDGMAVLVEHAKGEVCDRCRMIKEDVGTHEHFEHLCNRCATIVEAHYPDAIKEGLE